VYTGPAKVLPDICEEYFLLLEILNGTKTNTSAACYSGRESQTTIMLRQHTKYQCPPQMKLSQLCVRNVKYLPGGTTCHTTRFTSPSTPHLKETQAAVPFSVISVKTGFNFSALVVFSNRQYLLLINLNNS
jgi:hypothetical protein